IGADNNFVYGNNISGNTGAGVGLLGGAKGNIIGEVGALANSISGNSDAGIVIRDQGQNYYPTPDGSYDFFIADAPPTGTVVRGNAVFGNTGPDIDVAADVAASNTVAGNFVGPDYALGTSTLLAASSAAVVYGQTVILTATVLAPFS